MKIVNIKDQSGDIHCPIMQAVPTKIENNWFLEIFKFFMFRRKWKIREDYCLWVPELARWIFIPAYFIFDGASVPKLLNGIYSPTGMLLLGAVPHDFGYRYKGLFHIDHNGKIYFVEYSKKQLDHIFEILNTYESGMAKASYLATKLLGVVGYLGWWGNRKKNKVLMEDFPEVFVPEEE